MLRSQMKGRQARICPETLLNPCRKRPKKSNPICDKCIAFQPNMLCFFMLFKMYNNRSVFSYFCYPRLLTLYVILYVSDIILLFFSKLSICGLSMKMFTQICD